MALSQIHHPHLLRLVQLTGILPDYWTASTEWGTNCRGMTYRRFEAPSFLLGVRRCCPNVSTNWARVVWQPQMSRTRLPLTPRPTPTGAYRVNSACWCKVRPPRATLPLWSFAAVWNTASSGDCPDWEVLTWSRQLRLTQEAGVKRRHSSGWWVRLQ